MKKGVKRIASLFLTMVVLGEICSFAYAQSAAPAEATATVEAVATSEVIEDAETQAPVAEEVPIEVQVDEVEMQLYLASPTQTEIENANLVLMPGLTGTIQVDFENTVLSGNPSVVASDDCVEIVSNNYGTVKVLAKEVGTAYISMHYQYLHHYDPITWVPLWQSAYYTWFVVVMGEEATAISFAEKNVSMDTAASVQLIPVLTPSDAYTEYTWHSEDENVVTVSDDGMLTPIAPGTTVITVTTTNGLSDTCVVSVTEAAFEILIEHPTADDDEVSVDTNIYLFFSKNIQEGKNFSQITLSCDGVPCDDVEIVMDGMELSFIPEGVLEYNKTYEIYIPADALENADGVSYSHAIIKTFTTQKRTCEVRVDGGTGGWFYEEGDTVTITADEYENYQFVRWTSENDIEFKDETASTTTFIALGEDVVIEAVFEYVFEYVYVSTDTGEEVTITNYRGSNTVVEIPQMVDGRLVTKIGDAAFENCSTVQSISISNGVAEIGASAFAGCTKLNEMNFPQTLTQIGASAFADCTKLEEIVFPQALTQIGASAFAGCTKLEDFVFPQALAQIGTSAFANCTALNEVVLPSALTSIEAGLFENCVSLKTLVIPASVTTIGDNAFAGCEDLSQISIPQAVQTIACTAFDDCAIKSLVFEGAYKTGYQDVIQQIEADVDIVFDMNQRTGWEAQSNAYAIVDGLFVQVKDEKIVVIGSQATEILLIPNTISGMPVDEIAAYAFKDDNMEYIILSDSVTKVGEGAFQNCDSVKSITIGKNIQEVGDNAFDCFIYISTYNYHSSALIYVYFHGDYNECTSEIYANSLKSYENFYGQKYTVKFYYNGDASNWATTSFTSSIPNSIVVSASENLYYTGQAQTQTIDALYYNGVEKTSYTLAYNVATECGDYEMLVKYSGVYIVQSFAIVDKSEVILEKINTIEALAEKSTLSEQEIVLANQELSELRTLFTQTDGIVAYDDAFLQSLASVQTLFQLANQSSYTEEFQLPTVQADVADADAIPMIPVTYEGLAFSALGGTEFVADTTLWLALTQEKSEGDSLLMQITPMLCADGTQSALSYDTLQTPVAVKLYLNESFPAGEAVVTPYSTQQDAACTTVPVCQDAQGSYIEFAVQNEETYYITPKQVTAISLETIPTKMVYYLGQAVDLEGGSICVQYNDGTSEIIALSQEMISGFDGYTVGECSVSICYRDCQAESGFSIVVLVALGDVSQDGTIGIKDAIAILQYCNGTKLLSNEMKAIADVDRNGIVSVDDAQKLLEIYSS